MTWAELFKRLEGPHREAQLAYGIEVLVRTARHALEARCFDDLAEIEDRDRGVAESLAMVEGMASVLHEAVEAIGLRGR